MITVPDTSVVAKLLMQEKDSDIVREKIVAAGSLIAPEQLTAEIGNLLWKTVVFHGLPMHEAMDLLTEYVSMPIEIVPHRQVVRVALDLSCQLNCTVYDALFLAVAQSYGGCFVTADEALLDKVRHRLPFAVSLADWRPGTD